MSTNTSNNKNIAKNTVYLYVRTALTMLISLYASRVILHQLGVADYGIYNVVGGVVALLSSLSSTLLGTTQRYITFSIGKKDDNQLRRVFTASCKVHLLLALICLVIAETVGLWFINCKMSVPEGRLFAANVVFQTSVLAFLFDIATIPNNAAIIAYERFKFFAFAYIIEAVGRLGLILCLPFFPFDKLIVYGFMQMGLMIALKLSFIIYVRFKCPNCQLVKHVDKGLYKELLSFTGWNFFGTASYTIYGHGSNLLLNVFYGVLLNAAKGVTAQVENAVTSFVTNFTMAINPQITKSYASGDYKYTNELIFFGVKISSFLLLIVGFPIVVNINYILNLWLVEVPDYTETFVLLALLAAYISSINTPFNTAIFATGDIKLYQIVSAIINVTSVILLYLFFRMGFRPEIMYIITIAQAALKFCLMSTIVKKAIDFPLSKFLVSVYLKNILFLIPVILVYYLKSRIEYEMTLGLFLLESAVYVLIMVALVYSVGLSEKERKAVFKIIKRN